MLQQAETESKLVFFDAYEEALDEPVTLVNVFYVSPKKQKLFRRAWQKDADFFEKQPGCLSYQLHQSMHDSHMFLNYIVFKNTAAFTAVTEQTEFGPLRETYLDNAVAHPHFFRRVEPSEYGD